MAKAWEELGPQLWAFFHNSVQINMIRVKPAEISSLNADCERLFSAAATTSPACCAPPIQEPS